MGRPGQVGEMGKMGINAKAVEGRERKKTAAEEKEKQKQAVLAAKEAETWKVGAKSTDKKEAEEAKRLEKLAKKKEREALEAEEAASIKTVSSSRSGSKQTAPPVSKKTQFELLMQSLEPSSKKSAGKQADQYLEVPTEPLNRPGSAFSASRGSVTTISEYSASNVDDAISLLEATNLDTQLTSLDRHPERRVKAAYAVFEETEMPILKLENPGLRMSQLRELLKKKWAKSLQNPMNQASISYRATREEEREAVRNLQEKQLDKFRTA